MTLKSEGPKSQAPKTEAPQTEAPMPARVAIVTLGVADLARSSAFYERLGWTRRARQWESQIRFFALDNLVLALFPRAALAEDATLPDTPPGFGGMTLAINFAGKTEVDRAFAHAVACGARPLKPPVEAEWGGYSGYVADLDGHPWELAFNPFFPCDARGRVELPE